MSSIDQRIVQMQFDNAKFEQGAKTTMSTLDKLKSALNFDKSAKNLQSLQATSSKINFSGLSSAVETIAGRFTNLGIVGVTALQNITNAVISTGTQMVKSLTLDPILSGFNEYETKMGSITTILTNTQSKGTTLDDVNRALDELNTYADQTIYNFAEMTRNIGTFTAAGVDLDTSVKAIKGIANLAAGSGSTSVQASTAMYQLSQALAAGRVSLQDWNSVVNAGMGGELFQNALKETAKQMGIVVDESVSFRESISAAGGGESWLTSDVLIKTLEKFADDETLVAAATQVKTITQLFDTMGESVQSGWAQSWEYIIGNKDQATETLTAVSNAFNNLIQPSTDARNSMLKFWNENGGRDATIEAISNAFEGLASILSPIKNAFDEIFPSMTGEQLVEFSERLRDLTEGFKISEKTANNLNRTFKGVFSIFDIGIELVKTFAKGFIDLVGFFLPAGNGLLEVTTGVGDYVVALDEAIKNNDLFNVSLEKIEKFLSPFAKGIKKFATDLSNAIKEFVNIDTSGIESFSEKVTKRFEPFSKIVEGTVDSLGILGNVLKKIFPIMSTFGTMIGKLFNNLGEAIGDSIGELDFDGAFDVLNSGIFTVILLGIKKFFDNLSDVTSNGSDILGSITGVLDGVKGSLETWQKQIQSETLIKIATAIAILTASLVVLSMIDSKKLTTALTSITFLFADLIGSMMALEKFVNASGNIFQSGKLITMMIGMSVAIVILSSAMKKLSDIDWDGIGKGLLSVATLSGILVASSMGLSKVSGGLIRTATGLVIFSAAINVLSIAVEKLGSLDIESLTKGLVAVGVLCTELALFMKATDLSKMGVMKSTGIVILASSLLILSSAVKSFSELNTTSLIKGLTTVGVLLTEISLFTKLTGNSKNLISTATGLTIVASSMIVFGIAIDKISKNSWEDIGKGLVTLAASLTSVTVAVNLMPKDMMSKSVGLIGIATSMVIFSEALTTFGNMSLTEIGKSLLTLAGSLTAISVAMLAMRNALPGASALLVVSSALLIFLPVLKTMSSMSFTEIAAGLLTLAGVFVVFGVAGLALQPLVPTLITLSAAIALFGAGCLAVGAGVLAFSAGLASLAVSGTAAAASLVVIISSIASLMPMIFEQIGNGIVKLAEVISKGAPAIADAFIALVIAVVDSLVETVPELLDGLGILLSSVLDFLIEYVPVLGDALVDLFIMALGVLESRMPEVVSAGLSVINALLRSLSDAFGEFDPTTMAQAMASITMLVTIFGILAAASYVAKQAIKGAASMLAVMGIITLIFVALGSLPVEKVEAIAVSLSTVLLSLSASMAIISLIPVQGAATGVAGMAVVVAGLTAVLAALGGIAQIPGVKWLISEGTTVLGQIGNAIGSFAGNIIAGFATGVSSSFPKIGQDLADFMNNAKPFFDGLDAIDSSSLTGVATLTSSILVLTASDVLEGLTSWFTGGNALLNFGIELAQFAPYFRSYYESIKGIDGSVVEASANAAMSLAEFANNVPNTGGVASWFAGDNTLSEFAEELMKFGPKLKAYAMSVTGLPTDVVINSANAAMAMAEMANNLPNMGGVASWFAGDNGLAEFGEELAKFGPKLKLYAMSVTGLPADVVISSANAAKALSELASNLPNSGGLVSWFTGDNNIGDFGKDLVTFGQCMSEYYNSLAGIDFSVLNYATTQFSKLVDLAESMTGVDYTGFLNFSSTLGQVGSSGVEVFINAFEDSTVTAETAGRNLAKTVVNTIKNYLRDNSSSVENQAKTMVRSMTNAMSDTFTVQTPRVQASVQLLLHTVMQSADNQLQIFARVFNTGGQNLMNSLANGISVNRYTAGSALTIVMNSLVLTANEYSDNFYTVGANMMFGLARGIRRNQSSAINAAAAAASASLAAAKRRLNINSPSKEFEWIGEMSDRGLARGFDKYGHLVETSAIGAADVAMLGMQAVLSRLNTIVNEGMDVQPVITPVMDLSNVYAGVGAANSLLNNQNGTYFGGIYTGNLGRNIQAIRTGYTPRSNAVQVNNREVVQAINDLGERLDGMARSIENLKLVTNTGALVGQMEGKIDQRLGVRQKYKDRGI